MAISPEDMQNIINNTPAPRGGAGSSPRGRAANFRRRAEAALVAAGATQEEIDGAWERHWIMMTELTKAKTRELAEKS